MQIFYKFNRQFFCTAHSLDDIEVALILRIFLKHGLSYEDHTKITIGGLFETNELHETLRYIGKGEPSTTFHADT